MNLVNEKWLSQQIPPKKNCNWKKEEILDTQFDDVQMSVPIIQQNVAPVGLFEQFFDDDVIVFIVNLSNLYANRDKGKHEFKTNASEIRLFIAMLLLTGYNPLPRKKLYWKILSDVHNAAMLNAMSRNRFEEILSVLHLSDNMNLDKQNKMTKVIPFYEMPCNFMTKRCIEN